MSRNYDASNSPKKPEVKRSLSLSLAATSQCENVAPSATETFNTSEGACPPLVCEEPRLLKVSDYQKDPSIGELTSLDHEDNRKIEYNVLEKDPNEKHPNSSVKDRTPKDPACASLIKDVVKRNWKTATNILLFKIKETKPYIQQVLRKVVGKEFFDLCKVGKSILRKKTPKELVEFSNQNLAKEVSKECPLWNSCLVGACGISLNEEGKASETKDINAIAAATAVVAKHRNNQMSAFAYRISSILMHSGAKEADFTCLNRLGLCMSHKETLVKQREMGRHHDEKVKSRKENVISRKNSVALIDEILAKQEGAETQQMSLELAKDCHHYSDETFEKCNKAFANKLSQGELTNQSFEEAKSKVMKGYNYR